MTECPIPFRDWEVRAILDGRKTQTRRVMKPQPAPWVQSTPDRHPTTRTAPYIDAYCGERKTPENPRGMSRDWHWWTADDRLGPLAARCPYGAPGDTLWVREAHALSANPDLKPWYRLDHPEACGSGPRVDVKWRPSIHMPRWASRITLRITDVRVERLQDISEDDARAEGVHRTDWEYENGECCDTDRDAFRALWNHINGLGAWAANPWVWVVSFERVKP